jgi:hypothetical protein
MANTYQKQAEIARRQGNEEEARDHDAMAKLHQAKENDPKYHKAESEYHFREESNHKIAALHPSLAGRAKAFVGFGATGAYAGSTAGAALGGPAAPLTSPAGSIIGAAIGAPSGVAFYNKMHALRSNIQAKQHASAATKHLERSQELSKGKRVQNIRKIVIKKPKGIAKPPSSFTASDPMASISSPPATPAFPSARTISGAVSNPKLRYSNESVKLTPEGHQSMSKKFAGMASSLRQKAMSPGGTEDHMNHANAYQSLSESHARIAQS